VGAGLPFTIGSGGVQFRYFGRMFSVLRQGFHHEQGHISSFQALVVSVAGRVGSGNIAGVAVAITLGGPGAVFWMWVIGQRGLAVVYSVLLLVTFGLGFNAVQSYVVATSLEASFGVATWVTGLVMVLGLAVVIFGGIRRIAIVSELIVPVMALMYLCAAVLVIGMNITAVPAVLGHIVQSAFGLEQAVGGGLGVVIMQGVKRGLFSNEAGLGSAPNVAAVAHVPHPVNQGHSAGVQCFSRHHHHVQLYGHHYPVV